jgi:hypothetical protein
MKGKKSWVFNLLFPLILYSFETQGSFWPQGEVWVAPNLGGSFDYWVNNYGTLYWGNKNYELGPANVEFLPTSGSGTGIVEVIWANMPTTVYGKTFRNINNCREITDMLIWVNYNYYSQWTSGKFATVIRHEIGHAAGLDDEPDDTSVIMYPYLPPFPQIPNFKSVKQDDINGLGCLYGGSFNWGSETFTLREPKGGATYECEIPVSYRFNKKFTKRNLFFKGDFK